MGWVYTVVALFVLGAGGYGVWSYNSALEEAERAKAEAKVGEEREAKLRETIKLMDDAKRAADELARKRWVRAATAEEAIGKLTKELEVLRNADTPSRDWANEPVPSGIRKLREEGVFTPAMPNPDSKPLPNPNPAKNG